MSKPKIITKCVANSYACPDERIIELSNGRGAGALISVRKTVMGLRVDVYHRTNCEVIVSRGNE